MYKIIYITFFFCWTLLLLSSHALPDLSPALISLHIQEVREPWLLGVWYSQTNQRMFRLFPCYFAPQTTAQSPWLPLLPLISLSLGCHGELRMNSLLSPVSSSPCFLLCFPLSAHFSSSAQVSSSIILSSSDNELHICLSSHVSMLWDGFLKGFSEVLSLISHHFLSFMSSLLNSPWVFRSPTRLPAHSPHSLFSHTLSSFFPKFSSHSSSACNYPGILCPVKLSES